jgi:hypothetical protein
MKEWKFDKYFNNYNNRFTNVQLGVLGALDRIFLIGIAFSSTVPSLANYLRIIGFWGVFIMLFVYVVTGTFSFILDDAILRGELQQEELLSATRSASHPYINFPSTITTRPESPDYSGGGY